MAEDPTLADGQALAAEIDLFSLESPEYADNVEYDDDLEECDDDFRLDGGSYAEEGFEEDQDDMDAPNDDDGDDDMKDWPDATDAPADEAVHLPGLPRSDIRLNAKQYKTPAFSEELLRLLVTALSVPGWAELAGPANVARMNVHKVSGSLTNAVFFISYPPHEEAGTPTRPTGVQIIPPTVLLRIYGPSSGNLISRRKELHVLNTLSAVYNIGPAILGTFANGRVEEYFESRALYKEELRIPRVSRWIARRMRELHGVDIAVMELPPESAQSERRQSSIASRRRDSQQAAGSVLSDPMRASPSPYSGPVRPGPVPLPGASSSSRSSAKSYEFPHTSSQGSVLSTSAASAYSFTSAYSSASASSASTYGRSPYLRARSSSKPGPSEGSAPRKRRSTSSLSSRSDFTLDEQRKHRPKSVVWTNIDAWTKEARKVLKKVGRLETLLEGQLVPGFVEAGHIVEDVNPLLAPSTLLACKAVLNISQFYSEVKRYRRRIAEWEAQNGKSKRVFAHNDAQCGNLLRLTPNGTEEMVEGLQAPHEMVIVVDFEYAGVNPRGFDIANHFLEWRTDYHHATLSHSVTKHSDGPTAEERQRFYRAYIPLDGGIDVEDPAKEPSVPPLDADDPRVRRLEDEVQLWTAASHAMYTVWSIVQSTDDIVRQVDAWLADPESAKAAELRLLQLRTQLHKFATSGQGRGNATVCKPILQRGKSGEEIHLSSDPSDSVQDGRLAAAPAVEIPQIGDFDYLSYALERVNLFRDELDQLSVPTTNGDEK